MKYTEVIFSNSPRKLLWFEITKMLTTVLEKNIVSFTVIFGTLSFPITDRVSEQGNAIGRVRPSVRFQSIF